MYRFSFHYDPDKNPCRRRSADTLSDLLDTALSLRFVEIFLYNNWYFNYLCTVGGSTWLIKLINYDYDVTLWYALAYGKRWEALHDGNTVNTGPSFSS